MVTVTRNPGLAVSGELPLAWHASVYVGSPQNAHADTGSVASRIRRPKPCNPYYVRPLLLRGERTSGFHRRLSQDGPLPVAERAQPDDVAWSPARPLPGDVRVDRASSPTRGCTPPPPKKSTHVVCISRED